MRLHDVLFWIGLIVVALLSYAIVRIYQGIHLIWQKCRPHSAEVN